MNIQVGERETCRLCAGMHSKSNMTCLFTESGVGHCILERIQKYTPFQINAEDCLPKFVCIICTTHIDHWHSFLQLCLKAQENFITPVKINQDTDSRNQVKVPAPCGSDDSTTVAQPAVNSVVKSIGNQERELPQVKHRKIFLDVNSRVAEKLKTCSSPDSTGSEIVSTACVRTTKVNTNTYSRRNYCIARWCNNSTRCSPSLSLFRVPRNRTRAAKWLMNAEREDLMHLDLNLLYSKFLCSKHFTEDMFTNCTRNKLVWNAVPTVFPRPRFAEKMSQIQSDAAVQRMAMEMLYSSVPTRIMPKPDSKISSSPPMPVDTVSGSAGICEMKQRPVDLGAAKLKGCGSSGTPELLDSIPLVKTAQSSVKGCSDTTTLLTDAQPPQSVFLTESMCSFQESHEPVFPCRYCGEMFLVKSSLILHQTTYHPEHSVGCEQCGKVNYSSKSEFMGHLCEHTEVAMEQM